MVEPTDRELLREIRDQQLHLSTLFRSYGDDTNESGISITAYGKGQLTGATYTVPPHGEITVSFKLKILSVTKDQIRDLDDLILSLLEASKQSLYKEIENISASGGTSFFGFFGLSASASYSKTKQKMESWGLSEENQRVIVGKMMELTQQMNEIDYQGTVYNRDNSYSVSGNLFGIVMDATIKQREFQNQIRMLAPKPIFQSGDGAETLQVQDPLYR
jgi:hypothetical protein